MTGTGMAAAQARTRGGQSSRLLLALLTLTVVTLAPLEARAQSDIAGVVKDTSGAVLPGVTVEAASPVLIEKVRTVVTDAQGRYDIADLRPGIYTVTFALTGFNTVKREGLDLPSSFTATVNAELPVGTLAETITVSGQAPVVDTQSTVQNRTLSKDLLEAVPTGRLPQTYSLYIPGVSVSGGSSIGTGLSNSTAQTHISIHGSQGDSNVLIDGISESNLSSAGGVYYYVNAGYLQEQVVTAGGAGAEQQQAGVWQNIIPKEGGNRTSGTIYGHYTDENFLQDNVPADLRALGVSSNSTKREWNFNPSVGFPIMQDKLWFFGSYLHQGSEVYAGTRYNLTPTAWVYTPDPSRPVATELNGDRSNAVRFTWQATPKNKVSVFFDLQPKIWKNRSINSTTSPEATTWSPYIPLYLAQVTWKSPLNSRFLLEAGAQYQNSNLPYYKSNDPLLFSGPPGSQPDPNAIGATELTTGRTFRAALLYGNLGWDHIVRIKAAGSYVTGTHAFKVGMDLTTGERYRQQQRNGDYTVSLRTPAGNLIGVPASVTLWAPDVTYNDINADVGVYAQDKWTVGRMTLNLGVRFDAFNGGVPAQEVPANRWLPARTFAPVDGVPRWKDVVPRLGVSYDVFGSGKTALKAVLNKYVNGYGIQIPTAANPVATSVLSANRTWTDRNGNFIPDCDFGNPAANLECGVLSNLNFGQNNANATRYDPAVLTGFGARDYNWESSVALQQQLLPGVALNAAYFRRWYGNLTITDNQLVTPADYSPYCLTVPVDPRLPGGGGNQLCGFYDVSPAKQGQTQNFVTFASKFPGDRSQVFNGIDLTVSARWGKGAQVTGGTSVGRTEIKTCQATDSPQALLFCDSKPPFQQNIKFLAVYPLPWGLQVAGAVFSISGPEISATTYVATNDEVRGTLGRNLAAGATATVTLPLMNSGTSFSGRVNKLDVRFTRTFPIGRARILGSLDVFNLFNSNDASALNTRYGPNWLQPTTLPGARLFRFAAQLDF